MQLATEVGLKPVTIVGIFKLGNASTIGGATIVGTTFEDAQQWFDRVGQTSTISVKADPGVSQEELKQRIIAAVPNDVKVQTGPEAAEEQANQTAGGINDFLTPLLLAFAGATVFAGAFIIFNTFAITVAQRTREFAMLRTIGASRRQVLRSVLLEALVIGLLASVTGIVAGVGFAKLLDTLFDSIGFGLPARPSTWAQPSCCCRWRWAPPWRCWPRSAPPSAPPGCRRWRPCARAPSCRRRGWPATPP